MPAAAAERRKKEAHDTYLLLKTKFNKSLKNHHRRHYRLSSLPLFLFSPSFF
jgi:hypothetical protein